MNEHAGWTKDGQCIMCGTNDARSPCDPEAVKKKLLVIVQRGLKNYLVSRKRHDLNANDSDVLPGT